MCLRYDFCMFLFSAYHKLAKCSVDGKVSDCMLTTSTADVTILGLAEANLITAAADDWLLIRLTSTANLKISGLNTSAIYWTQGYAVTKRKVRMINSEDKKAHRSITSYISRVCRSFASYTRPMTFSDNSVWKSVDKLVQLAAAGVNTDYTFTRLSEPNIDAMDLAKSKLWEHAKNPSHRRPMVSIYCWR